MDRGGAMVKGSFCYEEETQLTVMKTSLFFAGDGFAAYDSQGKLVFRVDSYGPNTQHRDEIVLMDAAGKCLLTLRKKWPSLHRRWEGFQGEGLDGQKPFFTISRSSIIDRSRGIAVEVYGPSGESDQLQEEYQIEGSFSHRSCTFYNNAKDPVAEIKRKTADCANVMLGKEVFLLSLEPGFDAAFAMGLVLVLDEIDGQAEEVDDPKEVNNLPNWVKDEKLVSPSPVSI